MRNQILCLAAVMTLLTEPAFAGPGVKAGRLEVTSSVRAQTALVVGTNSESHNRAGVVRNSAIGGNARVRSSGGVQTALAFGYGGKADTKVGTVENANIRGSADVTGVAKSATALSMMPGSKTCVSVGSVGPGSYGSVRTTAAVGSVIAYNLGFFRRTRVNVGSVGRPC